MLLISAFIELTNYGYIENNSFLHFKLGFFLDLHIELLYPSPPSVFDWSDLFFCSITLSGDIAFIRKFFYELINSKGLYNSASNLSSDPSFYSNPLSIESLWHDFSLSSYENILDLFFNSLEFISSSIINNYGFSFPFGEIFTPSFWELFNKFFRCRGL
jgi:hypothetical protein